MQSQNLDYVKKTAEPERKVYAISIYRLRAIIKRVLQTIFALSTVPCNRAYLLVERSLETIISFVRLDILLKNDKYWRQNPFELLENEFHITDD